jgi:hypothetical protein
MRQVDAGQARGALFPARRCQCIAQAKCLLFEQAKLAFAETENQTLGRRTTRG